MDQEFAPVVWVFSNERAASAALSLFNLRTVIVARRLL
jgi:hypothetical protein